MQLLVLIINIILNVALLFIAANAVLSHDDQAAVDMWHHCMWSSMVLIVANLVFCIARMIILWRRGKKEKSLWGIVVLFLLPVGAYYLWGGYLLVLAVAGGLPGGD